MASDQSLIRLGACDIVDLLAIGAVTPLDLLDTLEERIAAADGVLNALPTLCFDRARARAVELLDKPVAERGRLGGLPIPIKDLTEVKGVRTTWGSPIYRDHVPNESDPLVETLEAQGGLVYAKSNTPEFGAGASTFNEVFGITRNPWNTGLSAAGSSGGAASALASGMAWVAHGSDMGGSLRNPASFCGVVGFRPSPGRVATDPGNKVDRLLSVEGPMARNVDDVALLFDAMLGESPVDPISLPRAVGDGFLAAARSGWKPKKVAFSSDLGITPVDPEVAEICRKAALKLADAGVIVEEAHPDLSEAHECFAVLRAVSFACAHAEKLKTHRDLLKPDVIWNIEKGLALTMDEIVRAETRRATIIRRANAFFDDYDLLLCPATIVAAFPAEQRYLTECAGHVFANYVEWLGIVYAITLTAGPALSLPCGFTMDGRPVGLQVVGRPRAEARVLAGARLLEDLLGLKGVTPIDPRRP
jgi:amidase